MSDAPLGSSAGPGGGGESFLFCFLFSEEVERSSVSQPRRKDRSNAKHHLPSFSARPFFLFLFSQFTSTTETLTRTRLDLLKVIRRHFLGDQELRTEKKTLSEKKGDFWIHFSPARRRRRR